MTLCLWQDGDSPGVAPVCLRWKCCSLPRHLSQLFIAQSAVFDLNLDPAEQALGPSVYLYCLTPHLSYFSGTLGECSFWQLSYFLVRLFICYFFNIPMDFSRQWEHIFQCHSSLHPLTSHTHIGFASAQRVIQLNYCSINEDVLRMDCKYALPPDSPDPFCKYTNGKRLFGTTDPDEEQHAPFRKRATVRLFPGNICRLLFKSLPNGKSNFTCNIKYADSSTASKTSVVEKSKLALSVSLSVVAQMIHSLFSRLLFFLWLQSSSFPARPGVSCYRAAAACCWP